jgi:uncharacterized membrane protein YgcG
MRMKRRVFLSGLMIGPLLSTAVAAQGFISSIITQLRDQGFEEIRQERTLLGRIRIVATRSDGEREIIINPNTGEILRDLWRPTTGSAKSSRIINEGSGKGSGNDDEDDEDNDEDDDEDDEHSDGEGGEDDGGDDDDEDNSGEGGGNGGGGNSGGGNSGGGDDEGGDDDDDED